MYGLFFPSRCNLSPPRCALCDDAVIYKSLLITKIHFPLTPEESHIYKK